MGFLPALPVLPATAPTCLASEIAETFGLTALTNWAAPQLSVLMVNEGSLVLFQAATALRRQGVSVHEVGDARTAAARISADPGIGALVADVTLLEGEGLHLAARLLGDKDPRPAVELVLMNESESGFNGCAGEDCGTQDCCMRDVVQQVQRGLAFAAVRRNGHSMTDFSLAD